MPDWGNAQVQWQSTIMEGHRPAFPPEIQHHCKLLHQPAQQRPARKNPPLVSCEDKPETLQLVKAGVTAAESEASFGQ